jgi:nucleoside 2-deoxyribosyltransferase
VYVVSSLKNYRLNHTLDTLLQARGLSCFLPQRDALERTLEKGRPEYNAQALRIRNANADGIRRADLLIAIARNLGTDSAWECGFAHGLGKPVIVIRAPADPIEDVYMLFNSVERVLSVPDYDGSHLKAAIDSLDFFSLVRRRK